MLRLQLLFIFVLILSLGEAAQSKTLQKNHKNKRSNFFNFDCGAKKVLMLHNATQEKIYGQCYIPYICGEVRFCTSHLAPACLSKFQYMEGVQINGETVTSLCCTPSPMPNGEESCREVPIFDRTNNNRYVASTKASVAQRYSSTKPPGPFQKTTAKPLAPRKNNNRHNREISQNSNTEKVIVKLTKLKELRNTNEYIKAIKKLSNGYSLTVCTPICSSSTSTVTRTPTTPTPTVTQKRTERPTTQVRTEAPRQKEVHPPKKGLFGGNGHGCFSSDMTVVTPEGVKRMDELNLGDKVLVFTAESSSNFHPITWFHHRDPNNTMKYLDLKTASGAQLSITPNHLIPLIDCDRKQITASEMDQLMIIAPKFASKARIGSCIAVQAADGAKFKSDMIVSIKQATKSGLYSPITTQGTIVVNGIQTSCFNSVENHLLLKSIHSVWHRISSVFGCLKDIFGLQPSSETVQIEEGIPAPILFLLEVAKRVIPDYVFRKKQLLKAE